MKDLDTLFFTQDTFFNRNVQQWYIDFNTTKPINYKEFIVFGNAFYDVYFDMLDFKNDVVTKVLNTKSLVSVYEFDEEEFKYFITRYNSILRNQHSKPRIFFVLEEKFKEIKNTLDSDEQIRALDELSFDLNNAKSTLFAPVIKELESTDYNNRIENLRQTILSDKKNNYIKPDKLNKPLKNGVDFSAFLKESSKVYQDLFEVRVNDFISNTEATLFEFIELEIDFFEKCQYDLENFESSIDGVAHLGATAFSVLNKIVNEISYETFHFATKRKLEFLEVRKQKFVIDNTIHLEFHDGLSEIGEDEDKFNRQYKGVIADNFIKNFKNQNKGLPKDEKVNTLRQTIINSTVGPNPRFDQVTAKELDIFLKEIESNLEAYENKTIDPKFIPFVFDRPLDWYFNAKNIPNQDLVFATYDYFNEGRRKDLFDALFFLNFMYCQFDMVKLNFETPFKILDNLKALPINKEEQHILLGFILKWFGGYPVNNMNAQFDTTLRLIEREFLNYPIETSEKKFCHRDMNDYVRKKELENYLNLKINNPDIEIPIPESFKTTIAKEKTDAVSNVLPQNSEPYFVDEYKIQIVEILKPYFDTNQHDSLNDLIFSFKKPTKKLFFKSNGNRLADAFKTLFEENIITQCNKKQLESWIKLNFTYHNTAGEKNFEAKYLNDIISRQFSNCKKPLLYLSKNEEAEKVLKKT